MLVAATPVVWLGMLRLRPFQRWMNSQSLLNLARGLWKWADVHLLSLRARYFPGRYNQIADSLSRVNPTSWDWLIHKEVIQAIWDTYGRAEVDLFVDKQTMSDVVFRQGRARGSGPGCVGTQLAKIPLVCISTPTITMDNAVTDPRDDATCSDSSPILAKQAMVLSAAASTEGQTHAPCQ